MHTKLQTTLFLGLILGLMLGACSAPPSPKLEIDFSPTSPLRLTLTLSTLPKLGEEVLLTATVYTIMDVQDASAEIQLPEGAKLVDGNLTWQGDLMEDTSVQIQAKIVFTKEGNWTLRAFTQKILDANNSIGEDDNIYIFVSEEGSHFGFDDGCPDPMVAVYPLVNLDDGSLGEVRCELQESIQDGPPPPEPTPFSRSDSISN